MTEKLGEYEYSGNGKLLTNGEQYTVYETSTGIEAYPGDESQPVEIKRANFIQMNGISLIQLEGATPMR